MTEQTEEPTKSEDAKTPSTDLQESGEWYTAAKSPAVSADPPANNEYFVMDPNRVQEEPMRLDSMKALSSPKLQRSMDLLPRPWGDPRPPPPPLPQNGGNYTPARQASVPLFPVQRPMTSRLDPIMDRSAPPSQFPTPSSGRISLKRPLNAPEYSFPHPPPPPLPPRSPAKVKVISEIPIELVNLPEEEKRRWLKHQQAFNIAARYYKGMVASIRDETNRRVAEQAWAVLEQHFREFGSHLRERDDRERRRNLVISLVESTKSQLQNLQGML